MKSSISALGVLLALAFPFIDFGWLAGISNISLQGATIIVKLVVAVTLGVIAFGIRKRPLSFFHIRRFSWLDLAYMVMAIGATFLLVALAAPLIGYTGDASETNEATEVPLAVGLAGVLAAGIFEEFIYRGFLIEELGELLHNRWLAAAISVFFFGLAHGNSDYGWSLALVVPGLAGLVITLLYLWRRNLPICVLMHIGIDLMYTLTHRG